MSTPTIPNIEDIKSARERISGHAYYTPLLRSHILDEMLGAHVFLKAECLQRTGSFKFRGAYNAISAHGKDAIERGVIACSSGNHAQGVAEAGRLLGVDVTIVMPEDAPAIKRARTERSGAKIVNYDRASEDREAITETLAKETGAVLVHPFENELVIAGQGTAGLEIADQLNAQGVVPDLALTPAGGGGLLAGFYLSLHDAYPDAQIIPVEPVGFDDYHRSLQAGKILSNETASGSICDAIISPMAGELSFSIINGNISGGLVVSDEEALQAVAFAFNELKCVVEPGGAVALAALLSGKIDCVGKNVVVMLSGGNVDPEILQQALAG